MAAVRQRLAPAREGGRTLDERIAVRFPGAVALQARLIARLPPTARLRRATVARSATSGLAAYNRRDLAVVASLWADDIEYRPAREWVEAGLVEACYRGQAGYRRYVATVDQVWEGQNHLTPREVIDLGDRILLLADGDMRGAASGVPLQQSFALLCTLRQGVPVVAQEYYDHDEALRVVGIASA